MGLKEALLGKNLPIQHRFFNLITILYALAGVVGFVICFSFHVPAGITWGMLVFSALSLIFCALAKVTENYRVWTIIFYICINMVLMPLAYLKMGGFQVGADVWIIAGIILGVLTLPKKAIFFLNIPVCLIYAGLFYLIYRRPDLMWQVQNKNAALFVVGVTLSIAAIGLSLMLLYQRAGYEEQQYLNQVREKELERLIEELQKSKEHTQRINHAKTAFLKSMSEGMNAPISVLLEKSEWLMLSEDEQDKNAGMEVSSLVKTMASVIDNIVNLSMIESGEFALADEKYSLKEELQKIYDVIRVQAKKKDLNLVFDIQKKLPNVLRGDGKRIRQVIINLLTNAIRYTAVGEIRLKIEKEEKNDKTIKLRISVSDTGIGIKKEDIDSLFYRFNPEENGITPDEIGGVGLGLTVSNQILQLMGSTLEVSSEYGQGSTFSFSITQRIVKTAKGQEDPSMEEVEETKDSYEELLALDVRRMMEDMEGDK